MTDFSKAYRSEWHLYRVNPDTWADDYEVQGFMSAGITRDTEGDAPEIDAGSISVRTAANLEFERGYYRIAMVAVQNGAERVDVATLLCETVGGIVDRDTDSIDITGFSVLHPAATTHVDVGDFAAAGQDGAQKCASMLKACINAPIEVSGSFALADDYVFDIGTSVLESAWRILEAGGFCMYPDGRGTVHIEPMPSRPVLEIDRFSASSILPSVPHSFDTSDIPNRYTVDDSGMRAISQNDDPSSEVSHFVRGYWVDEYDDSPTLLDGETLQAYADRRLAELSTVEDKRTYSRRYIPGVHPYSIVRGSLQSAGLSGDMRIKSQEIECGNGIAFSETASREVKLWQSPTGSQSLPM